MNGWCFIYACGQESGNWGLNSIDKYMFPLEVIMHLYVDRRDVVSCIAGHNEQADRHFTKMMNATRQVTDLKASDKNVAYKNHQQYSHHCCSHISVHSVNHYKNSCADIDLSLRYWGSSSSSSSLRTYVNVSANLKKKLLSCATHVRSNNSKGRSPHVFANCFISSSESMW